MYSLHSRIAKGGGTLSDREMITIDSLMLNDIPYDDFDLHILAKSNGY